MKLKLLEAVVILICVFALFFAAFKIKESDYMYDETETVFANVVNNIDFYISNIESVLLGVYEESITGANLTPSQKEYITKMYILQNRVMFGSGIKQEGEKIYVDVNTFNLAYSYLFGTYHLNLDNMIELGNLNVERFRFENRKVVSCEMIEDVYNIVIQYTSRLPEKDVSYNVRYNIGYKGGTYFLIGYTIDKVGGN
ncbi:MAG: hypothetical protein IJ809_04300 [Clostridia bacterium]|nr:hypothetical protein [Clostridia bacterium]